MPPVLTYVRNSNKENALHNLFQSFLFLFIVLILCGCGSFSSRSSTEGEGPEGSGQAIELLQAKEEKLPAEARFLYDLPYQQSILSTCKGKVYSIYNTAYGTWRQYSDCKYKFHDTGDYDTTLNVLVGDQDDSINAVSYMEFASTESGQYILQTYGDGVITSNEKYCSVFGIGPHSIVKFVKPALCEALKYSLV